MMRFPLPAISFISTPLEYAGRCRQSSGPPSHPDVVVRAVAPFLLAGHVNRKKPWLGMFTSLQMNR